jgi:anaerobic selenocysteine-containing dehydrogenase
MASRLDSVCPLDCPDTCSLTVTVDAGRITKVDGSRRSPATDGFICAKVRGYSRRVYSALRIPHPLKRTAAKGEGRFERISWEEAIASIAARFRSIIATHGAEAILPYHYGGSNGLFSEEGADSRFFHLLGASRLMKTICAGPTGAASRGMYGGMSGVPPDDYPLARCIVLWGVNPSATSIHLMARVRQAQRDGAFVAVIDPRRTKAAASADLHLAPHPGTDVVLALAIANLLIGRSLIDREFVSRWVTGFEALAAAAGAYPVSRAAEICGVPAEQIESLAERYAASSPAVVRCGWGVERNRNGGNAVRAILALPAIAGKFGVRGGGFTMSLSRGFPINSIGLARPDLAPAPAREINMVHLGRVLTEPLDPPIAALFVYNANPVAMTPDQNRIIRGLQREDLFTVVHDQVMTDTAKFADVLLPATTIFEQAELHKSYGHHFLQYSEAVIEPVGEALSNVELFRRLAAALDLGSADLFREDELLRAALHGSGPRLGGISPAELRRQRVAVVHFDGRTELIQFGTDFPKTASGKVELQPPGFGPIVYQAPPASDLPLTLLSPASGRAVNSILAEDNLTNPQLEMHPHDAQVRGIGEQDEVRVFNSLGEVRVRVHLTERVRRGVVSLPKGLWRRSTLNGFTATALAPDHLTDYGEGACFNDARVEVARTSAPA